MPFLRFSRDKRGYETTALVHAGRRQGRSRQLVLYWFRTPPGVKVGRPALDDVAIRWIEEHNPDIEFDWPKILEARPPAASPSEDLRARRSRREKPDRKRPPSPQGRPAASAPVRPSAEPEPQGQEPDEEIVVADEAVVELPIEQANGREDQTRLRARYAELLARIAERGGDAARIEALKAEAEFLNPDTWVTEEETRKGLAEFEPKLREMRAALGLRRRRRSRRGGRRRSGARPSEPERGEG